MPDEETRDTVDEHGIEQRGNVEAIVRYPRHEFGIGQQEPEYTEDEIDL